MHKVKEKKVSLQDLYNEVRALRRDVSLILPNESLSKRQRNKKIPAWLQASLQDVEEGRVSGPFKSVEDLTRHLG